MGGYARQIKATDVRARGWIWEGEAEEEWQAGFLVYVLNSHRPLAREHDRLDGQVEERLGQIHSFIFHAARFPAPIPAILEVLCSPIA